MARDPRRAEILTVADRRAYQAYENVFARGPWGGSPTGAQVFGVLRALIDHPAVTLAGQRDGDRLEIRHGRLRLRFADAGGGALEPHFDLLGCALTASQAALALRDDRHLIHVYSPDGTPEAPEARIGVPRRPQVLLSRLEPQAVALVRALASAPARFPVEAHDALATRLEGLQETLDVEFPSQWTRTIAPPTREPSCRCSCLHRARSRCGWACARWRSDRCGLRVKGRRWCWRGRGAGVTACGAMPARAAGGGRADRDVAAGRRRRR